VPLRRSIAAALTGLAIPLVPLSAHADPHAPTSADLPRLTRELAQVTAHAQALTEELDQAAARDGGLRTAYARLQDARYDAQLALDTRAQAVYVASAAPMTGWQLAFAPPEAHVLARRAAESTLTVDRSLVDAVTVQTRQVAALQHRADAFRRSLARKARGVLAEEDRAAGLYAQAKAIADAEHDAQVQAQLEAQRALLDSVSTTVALALSPAQADRARRALDSQAPVIALLEQSGSGIPPGYTPTGEVLSGTASWYGPGFEGRPTASGAPYDSQRLTCANKELPLGTVIHVTANGFAVNCLVNDRGPYVGDRLLDMSRAGARALGYAGLAQVTIDVLTAT
jgi:rare lipoprotein A